MCVFVVSDYIGKNGMGICGQVDSLQIEDPPSWLFKVPLKMFMA